MIVVGVDPGASVTGYGVVKQPGQSRAELIECGVIRTDSSRPLEERLELIFDGITEVIGRHQPDCMSIESVFYAKNVRTTLVLGHARGVILLAAKKGGLAVHEYPPREIKKCVAGSGSATKEQVQFMLTKLLHLQSPPEPHDASDGVAAALAHLQGARLGPLVQSARAESRAASERIRAAIQAGIAR